ncbi:response regulator transcription factor [Algibacter sp.]|nr:response regulator transcription factor [Algibacter sp.]
MVDKDFTIVIADDHPMLLNGLYEALVSNGYNVIGKAQNGTEALQLILELKPTLAILDVEMPFMTGFEVIKYIKEKNIPTKFIIQTLHKNLEYITLALSLKIEGYLLKEDPFTAIEMCMEKVLNNESYFSDSIDSNGLLNATNEFKNLKLLTPSELVILKLISKQASTNVIAESLFVSTRTIEKHRSNIIDKLGLGGGEQNSLSYWAITHVKVISTF